MDNQDHESAVKTVVTVLRKATRLVQLAPFVYLGFYGLYLILGSLIPEVVLNIADALFIASPLTIVGMLMLSSLFKLCRWHKIACVFPALSQVEGFVDNNIITLTQLEVLYTNLAIGILALTYLSFAIRHFIYGAKRPRIANA